MTKNSRTLLFLFLIIGAFLATTPPAFSQASSGTASIAGLVTDPSGAVMPNVDVTVRNADTNVARIVQTNAAGRYEVVALQPGNYEVRAAAKGFATLVRSGITVAVGATAAVDLAMKISGSAETVTVVENTPTVETDKTDVSTVINLKDMMNLPMNGRRWDSFALTAPGASNDGGFGLISFRGMSGLYNNNMVDGMDNNQAFFSEAKGRTRLSYAMSIEAIQEFEVGASNFSAQYGRSAGGIVNAVSKTGANLFHGTFFYLIRDDSMNAANPVGGPQLIKLGLPPKPPDRRQQFGPSAGGPIKKDKLFYFLSYDQQLRNFPASIIPNSATFFTSAPNFPAVQNFYQSLAGPQARQGNQWVGMGRVDWNANSKNQLSGTVNILRWDSPNGIQTAPTHANHESANGPDDVNAESAIGRWTFVATPTFISDFRFQYSRDFEFEFANAPGPSVSVTNGINFGMPNFLPRPAFPDEKRYQVSQNLTWLHGRHSVKFGYDWTHVNDQIINLFQGGGVYSFSTLNNFGLDCSNPSLPVPLNNCSATPASGIPSGTIVGKHYSSFSQAFDSLGAGGATQFGTVDMAYYIEDTYKPTSRLSVNLGLRYELQTMPSLQGNPALPATQRINTDTNNFGPRVGFSWDPFGKQKTVIRAGVGMYYGRTQNSSISNFITNNGIRFVSYSLQPSQAGSPVFPNVLSAPPTSAGARPDVVFAATGFANPLIYQSEFSVEHEIFKDFTLGAVYMGTRGTRMPVFVDTNEFPSGKTISYTVCNSPQSGSSTTCSNPGRTLTVPLFTAPRPNTNYGYMTEVQSVVNTWYHGLVIQAKKRFSHGFQLQAGFTYSKAQDDDQNSATFTNNNSPLNPFNLKGDYSLSDFDQRKRFAMSAFWDLPFHNLSSVPLRRALAGFQISTIVTLADGRPYSGTISGNAPSSAGTASFGILGAGGSSRVPDVGRNTFTTPGFANIDVRLSREIKFSERFRWQLIAEAFNVVNRFQITGINTTQYNVSGTTLFPRTDFQSISAAGTNIVRERQLQLGTRFTF